MAKKKEELLKNRKKIGRPIYDYKKIMDEMLKWSKDEDSISMAQFCADRGYLPRMIWENVQKYEEFEDVCTLVKLRLAERRERLVNADQINTSVFHRYQGGYDAFLRKDEDEEKEKDTKRKKSIAQQQSITLASLLQSLREGDIDSYE